MRPFEIGQLVISLFDIMLNKLGSNNIETMKNQSQDELDEEAHLIEQSPIFKAFKALALSAQLTVARKIYELTFKKKKEIYTINQAASECLQYVLNIFF